MLGYGRGRDFPPPLYLVASVALFSINFLLGKVLVGQVPPFTLALLRWWVAAALLYPMVRGTGGWLPTTGRWGSFWLLGVFGVVANSVIYFALARTSAISAGLVNAATPAAAFFLAWPLDGERPTPLRLAGILLSAAGVLLLLIPHGRWHPNPGDLLMLINVVGWSLYTILGRRLMRDAGLSPGRVLLWTAAAGILELLPLSATEVLTLPIKMGPLQVVQVLVIGTFATAAAFWAWFRGTAVVGASRATAYMNLVPLLTAGAAALFLGEHLQTAQGLGGLLVLSGVYLAARSGRVHRA